jgi:hypothetical protein
MTGSRLGPRAFVFRAVIIVAAFAICHVAGLRAYTGVLCGMQSFAGESSTLAVMKGILYAMLYIATVVLAPIFIIAAGLLFSFGRGRARIAR